MLPLQSITFAAPFNRLSIVLALYLQGDRDDALTSGIKALVGLGIIIAIALMMSKAGTRRFKASQEAQARNQQSLANLKSDPTNADLRQLTLGLGRIYSGRTRNERGVTIFDEVALMNDIALLVATTRVRDARRESSQFFRTVLFQ